MRALSIVISRITGVCFIYKAIGYILMIAPAVAMYVGNRPDEGGQDYMSILTHYYMFHTAYLIGMAIVSSVLAWVLICRAGWLTRMLGVPESSPGPGLPVRDMLTVAAKTIGLYLIVMGLPALLDVHGRNYLKGTQTGSWTYLFPALLRIALGLLLVIWTHGVIKLITRGDRAEDNPAHEHNADELESERQYPDAGVA